MNPLLRLPVPTPRQAAMIVVVALSIGIVTGRAIGSGSAAADQPVVLAAAPPASTGSAGASGDGGGGGATLDAPKGNVEPEPVEPEPSEPAPEPSEPVAEEPVAEEPPAEEPPAEEPPAEEEDPTTQVAGTVVQVNPDAHGYTLATAEGDLLAVHARKLPQLGQDVEAGLLELANGTRKEVSRKEVSRTETGSDGTAKLLGTVTFVAADGLSYVISVRGASLLVHTSSGRPLPALLDLVTIGVRFAEAPATGLIEESLETSGKASGEFDMHGTVESVDPVTRVVVMPADDLDASASDISFVAAEDVDLEQLEAGDVIAATVTLNPDGTYQLIRVAADDDAKSADRTD